MSRGVLVVPSVWVPAAVLRGLCRQGPVFMPRVVTGVTASFMIVELALALAVSAGTVVSATGVTAHRAEQSQSGDRGWVVGLGLVAGKCGFGFATYPPSE